MNSANLMRISIGIALLTASIVPGCGDGPVDESITANGGAAGQGAGGKGTAGSAGSKSDGDAGETGVGGEAGSLGEGGTSSTGGSGGSNGSGGSSGSAGSGGSGGSVTFMRCEACEPQCNDWQATGFGSELCYEGPGIAQGGPAESFPLSLLCGELMDCMLATRCYDSESGFDITGCYCGTSGVACQTGGANGECKDEVEAAAESTEFGQIGARFEDTLYALGRAKILLDCYDAECRADCLE